MGHVATISLRLPRSLNSGIERVSKRDGCSINQFVAMAAAEKLAALEAGDYFLTRVARASLSVFDRIMSCACGEPPREGDEQWRFDSLCFQELLAPAFIELQTQMKLEKM